MFATLAALALTPVPPDPTPALPTRIAQDQHEDERCGLRFRPPKGWRSIAVPATEGRVIARYLSDEVYTYFDEATGWRREHTPEMVCVVLERDTDGDGERSSRPFRDYLDYLERTFPGREWRIVEEGDDESDDMRFRRYEVTVAAAPRAAPLHVLAWVFHAPDVDFALHTPVLETEVDKLRRTLEGSLRSFRLFERSGAPLPWIDTGEAALRGTLTPEERRELRVAAEQAQHAAAVEGLAKGWKHDTYGTLLLLHHDQARWAKKLGPHAAAFLAWLDETFPHIGEDEYVRGPVLRVCADESEASAFERGVRIGTGGTDPVEIITHPDDEGWVGWEVDAVNRDLLRHWMRERDPVVWSDMPEWLQSGLVDALEHARLDRKKIEFRTDDWDRDDARLAVQQGRATPPREIMKLTGVEFRATPDDTDWSTYFDRRSEAAMLVEFLLSKEATRCKQAKGLLDRYIETLTDVVAERVARDGPPEPPEDEEDEEEEEEEELSEEEKAERAKALLEARRERVDWILIQTFERVFADWSQRDWDKFQAAYYKYVT